jgi:prepilin-type N-terminal cleavage/methylation domain-containing protein
MISPRCYALNFRRAFTLVELMVTIVIISILASLTLAGLAGARNRSKVGKTESTIRKIDDLIKPLFDAYADRRVDVGYLENASPSRPTAGDCPSCYRIDGSPIPAKVAAWRILYAKRQLMCLELPESLLEMRTEREIDPLPTLPSNVRNSAAIRRMARTFTLGSGTTQAQQSDRRQSLSVTMSSAESLVLTLVANATQGDEMELFREDEFGDTDRDGIREFLDGWQRPIFFIRWPSGFANYSLAMNPDRLNFASLSAARPDALDLYRIDSNSGFSLLPLIYSAGPDGGSDTGTQANGYGIYRASGVRLEPFSPFMPAGGINPPASSPSLVGDDPDTEITTYAINVGAPVSGPSANVYRDNITNHDMRR